MSQGRDVPEGPVIVCDLVEVYSPRGGGIKTYLDVKKAFFAREPGYRHVLIVPAEADAVRDEGSHVRCEVRSPLIPGCGSYRFLLRLDKVWSILSRYRPHVVEVACCYASPLVAFAHRRRAPCAVVGFCHTDFPTAYVEPFLRDRFPLARHLGVRLSQWYMKAVYQRCAAVLAASQVVVARLEGMGLRNVHLVSLGVDTAVFTPARRDPSLRGRLGIGQHELMAVYAGRLDSEKRVDVLLDAFMMLPPGRVRLVVAGDGPLRERVAHTARTGRVVLLPFHPDRVELARLLASADLYVTAGPHETFGLSVVEAQACGLPVVGVRAGALVERVPEDLGILVPPDSPREMASAILALAADGMRRRGLAARRWVEEHLTWEASLRKLACIYGEVVRSGGVAHPR